MTGRPVIPVKRCMFEKCTSTRADTVNLDGQHERDLCAQHVEALTRALAEPALHVSWGRSFEERTAHLAAEIGQIEATHGAPPAGWFMPADADPPDYEEDWVYSEYRDPTPQEAAWARIIEIGHEMDDVASNYSPTPVVRVGLAR